MRPPIERERERERERKRFGGILLNSSTGALMKQSVALGKSRSEHPADIAPLQLYDQVLYIHTIYSTCPLTKFEGSLQALHEADEAAAEWLKMM